MANVQEKVNTVQEQVERAMERMGEAAQSVGQKVSDFFQGNPFESSVGHKIELATDANKLATENWGLNMEICDFINSTNEGPRDAIRAIKKRLQTQMGKNNAIVMFTLTVLETCVKNCDTRFATLVCQKEFVAFLVQLISTKHDAPQILQERILILIQSWADAFRDNPALSGVVEMYDELKAKGVEFPATNLDSMAPIITPKQTVFPLAEQKSVIQPATDPSQLSQPVSAATQQHQQTHIQIPVGQIQLLPDQMAKLRSELDLCQINMTVLRELIAQMKPTNDGDKLQPPEDFHFLQELHTATIEMQKRILDLIPVATNEEVTYELLSINDELNSTFEKYDRCMGKFNSKGVDITMIPSGSGSGTAIDTSLNKADDLINLDVDSCPKVKEPSPELNVVGKSLSEQMKEIDIASGGAEISQPMNLAKDNGARNEGYIHDQAEIGIHTVCHNKPEQPEIKDVKEQKNITESKKGGDDGL